MQNKQKPTNKTKTNEQRASKATIFHAQKLHKRMGIFFFVVAILCFFSAQNLSLETNRHEVVSIT